MGHKFLLLLFVISIIASSCINNDAPIEKEKMVQIIVDLQMAEATSAFDELNLRNAQKYPYYNTVCEKHGITRAQLDSALVFYSKDELLFKEIYDKVIDELHEVESKIDKGFYLSQRDTFMLGEDSAALFLAIDSLITDSIEAEIWHFNRSYSYTDSVNLRFEIELFNRERQRYIFMCDYSYSGEDGALEPGLQCGIENLDRTRKSGFYTIEKGTNRQLKIDFESHNLQQAYKLFFDFIDRTYHQKKLKLELSNIRLYKMYIEGVTVDDRVIIRPNNRLIRFDR